MSPSSAENHKVAAEHELLLLCARTELDDSARHRIARLVEGTIDWELLISLSWRHHSLPLLYHHLARDHLDRIPLSIREALRARYYLLAARNLEGTTQALRVLDALETAGTPAVAWKGPILAHSVYPGPELRIFNDLDILIRRQDVGTVRGVLEARGYQRVFGPDIPDDDLFSRNGQDVTMKHPAAALRVDLHWGTIGRYFSSAMDAEKLWPQHEECLIGGRSVRVLRLEPMVLALAAHGAKHGPHPWPALKWITDMEAIIRRSDASSWVDILEAANRTGCRRMLLLAVALADELLGAPIPDVLAEPIGREAWIRASVRQIRDRLLFPDGAAMTFAERLRFDLKVRERVRDRLRYRAARLLTPGERDGAPGSVSLLRVPLRLVRLGHRYLLNPRRGMDFVAGKRSSEPFDLP